MNSQSNGAILTEYNNIYRKSGCRNNKMDKSFTLASKIQAEDMLQTDLDYNKKDEIIKLGTNIKYSISTISSMFGYELFIVNRVFKRHKKIKIYDKKSKIFKPIQKIKSNHKDFIQSILKESKEKFYSIAMINKKLLDQFSDAHSVSINTIRRRL